MKKIITVLITLLFTVNSYATLITVDLDKDNYQQGDLVLAEIIISDFNVDSFGFQELIGAFKLDVNFDNTQLAFNSVTFGSMLNGGNANSSDQLPTNNGSSITLDELSFLFFDLFTLQDGLSNFTLASVEFTALQAGNGIIDLSNVTLGDFTGTPIVGTTLIGDNYTIAGLQSVTEPTSILLFMPLALFIMLRINTKLNK